METKRNATDQADAFVPPDLARFRFRLQAIDALHLPAYSGSALRGVLGFGLRRSACVTRQPTCEGCLLRAGCVYSTLFESPALDGSVGGRYAQLPHPFVLDLGSVPAGWVAPGAIFDLGINLIGPALTQAPYLIHALQLAGQRGLGKGGGRFRVEILERERTLGAGDWLTVYSADSGQYLATVPAAETLPAPAASWTVLRLRCSTPLRLKRQGHLVGAAEFVPADLLRALCERLVRLAGQYGGQAAAVQWGQLRDQAEMVRCERQALRWQDWTRYSSRQDSLMQLGGLLGDLHLSGPGLAVFRAALDFGQWVHVGKGTSFGLGAYRIEPT